jgi:polyisoprenoid-binding protein YceI
MSTKLAIGLLAAALPLSAAAAPESFTLHPLETYPSFVVTNQGFTNRIGRFDKTAGKFTIDRAAKTASLEVVIQAASVNTGDSERGSRARTRDEHLRTPDFFNAAEFPTISFKATKVQFNGDNPTAIEGEFTMLGVTKPLALKIDLWKCAVYPAAKKEACGGDASGTLKRSDFGMKFGIPAFSDEIKLLISFLGTKD